MVPCSPVRWYADRVVERGPTLVLDLGAMGDTTDLEDGYADLRAVAATVVLKGIHGHRPEDPFELEHDEPRVGHLVRRNVSERADLTYDEPIQATEEAAEAVAFLVARRVLDRVAYGRCRTRTGADYRLRRPGDADTDTYERLEVSGISGKTEQPAARLRDKLERMGEYPHEPPGFAIVTCFRDDPVQILIGRYAP